MDRIIRTATLADLDAVAAVEAAMRDVMSVLCDLMAFTPARITRT